MNDPNPFQPSCPIGLDDRRDLCSAATCRACLHDRIKFLEDGREADALHRKEDAERVRAYLRELWRVRAGEYAERVALAGLATVSVPREPDENAIERVHRETGIARGIIRLVYRAMIEPTASPIPVTGPGSLEEQQVEDETGRYPFEWGGVFPPLRGWAKEVREWTVKDEAAAGGLLHVYGETMATDLTCAIHMYAAALNKHAGQMALLTNPAAVHVNMMTGTIAKPRIESIIHVYGRENIIKALGLIDVDASLDIPEDS